MILLDKSSTPSLTAEIRNDNRRQWQIYLELLLQGWVTERVIEGNIRDSRETENAPADGFPPIRACSLSVRDESRAGGAMSVVSSCWSSEGGTSVNKQGAIK